MKKILFLMLLAGLTVSCQTYKDVMGEEPEQKVDGAKRQPMLNSRSAAAAGGNLSRPPVFAPPPSSVTSNAPQARGIMPPPQSPRPPLVITQNSAKVNPYGNKPLPSDRRPPAFNNQAMSSAPPVAVPVPRVNSAPGSLPTGSAIASIPSAPKAPIAAPPAFVPPKPPMISAKPMGKKEFPKLAEIPPAPVVPKPAGMDSRVNDLKSELNQAKSSRMTKFEAPVPPSIPSAPKVKVKTSSVPIIPPAPIGNAVVPTPPKAFPAPKVATTSLADIKPIGSAPVIIPAPEMQTRRGSRQAITTLSDLRPPTGSPSFGLRPSRYHGVDRSTLDSSYTSKRKGRRSSASNRL